MAGTVNRGRREPTAPGLKIGVGSHHGALPRPFLSAVEELLRARKLPVVVASPTLAQGIDLACSVLVFRSLRRFDPSVGRLVAIAASEFSNVLGRAGRAYVDLDGIAVLPTFKTGRAKNDEIKTFRKLVTDSRGQRLASGIAQLVWKIGEQICQKLGVKPAMLFDYVLNQQSLWSDANFEATRATAADEADEAEQDLDEMLSDLDLAILSLIEDADAAAETLAATLDAVLTGSLWKRTIARLQAGAAVERIEREIILSRARWLWHTTTAAQRKACFSAGLGKRAGLFLYDNIDLLIGILADLNMSVAGGDHEGAKRAAISFADQVFAEPFFVPNDMPANWRVVLGAWITGEAFSEILKLAKQTAGFVHDGVVFKLVWAAEAVRVQAVTMDHSRAAELGDGPALAFTHGLPSASAALLCQFGYASRTGALWLVERLGGGFFDYAGMREWESDHSDDFDSPGFWSYDDHRLLWERSRGGGGTRPREWARTVHKVPVDWRSSAPPVGARIRVIALSAHRVALCDENLVTRGDATVPFDAQDCTLDGLVARRGQVEIRRFGPA